MSSRKITIPLNVSTLGALLMVAGLALTLSECFSLPPHGAGWAGIVVALIGKHLLNRDMVARLEHDIEHQAEVQIQAFELGRRTGLQTVR